MAISLRRFVSESTIVLGQCRKGDKYTDQKYRAETPQLGNKSVPDRNKIFQDPYASIANYTARIEKEREHHFLSSSEENLVLFQVSFVFRPLCE